MLRLLEICLELIHALPAEQVLQHKQPMLARWRGALGDSPQRRRGHKIKRARYTRVAVGKLALIIALLFQVQPDASLVRARETLRQLKSQLEAHQATLGAATELTTAKNQLRDWIDS